MRQPDRPPIVAIEQSAFRHCHRLRINEWDGIQSDKKLLYTYQNNFYYLFLIKFFSSKNTTIILTCALSGRFQGIWIAYRANDG